MCLSPVVSDNRSIGLWDWENRECTCVCLHIHLYTIISPTYVAGVCWDWQMWPKSARRTLLHNCGSVSGCFCARFINFIQISATRDIILMRALVFALKNITSSTYIVCNWVRILVNVILASLNGISVKEWAWARVAFDLSR